MGKRSTFGSRFGTIAVVGGSVIGLGNIWRFPYMAGENGGAAFILIYITVSLLISVPIMLSEFVVGRTTKRNAMRAFKKLSGSPAWSMVGYLGILTAFIILSFYCVIAGWATEFIRESVAGSFMHLNATEIEERFNNFVANGWRPVIWTLIFILFTSLIVSFGIEKGIERFNKYVMPLMLLILIGMCIHSFFMSGFREAASFLLRPDFSKVSLGTVLQAAGQSFFSLSVGMGIMITYGSYLKKGENMFRVAGTVAVTDVGIAILSGLAIFPAVFSYGINPTSGPELVFLTLPAIFSQMPGGQFIAILFFFLLFSAAITSSISLMEVAVAYVTEEFRMRRRPATLIITGLLAITSTLCALSQMPSSTLRVAGMNLFDLFDRVTSTYMLPLGGLLIVLFAGWALNEKLFRHELTTDGLHGVHLYRPVRFMVRFVIPVVIVILFFSQLGLL